MKKKEMLINVLQPEECRIAIVEDGVLEELYLERTSQESYTGNIYKGKIVNLEPAIQAAFVDFSVGRNGFLHVSDVEPQYYERHLTEDVELSGRDKGRDPRRDRPRDEQRGGRPPESRGYRVPPPAPPAELDPPSDIDWDRPDRSEKGRRDRSRRFGEGLVDDWEEPSPPPPPPPAPPSREPEPPVAAYQTPAGWSEPRAVAAEDEPTMVMPYSPPPLPRDYADDQPRAGAESAPIDPAEVYLPPSRTQRSRPVASPEGGAPPHIEPRRGRGRGRPPRDRAFAVEPDTAPFEPDAEPEPTAPEITDELPPIEPRRRGGRAAILSRGGEREPLRPRETQFVDRPPTPAAERPLVPFEAGEPPHAQPLPRTEREPDVGRPRRRTRGGRARPVEPERERARPHARAGEPGYVPRRERDRDVDPFDPEAPTVPLDWPDPDAPAEANLEPHGDTELPTEAADDDAAQTEAARRRRGRRRGRRRERTEPVRGAERREPRPSRADDLDDEAAAPLGDDFDFDAIVEDEDEAGGLVGEVHATPADEEIDPELEEEIRREIEEIAELEREMGMRGPVEARPRRDRPRERDAEPEPGRPAGRGARVRGAAKPPIQEIFRRGDEALVQVIKESIGTKGPTLSTYISIPGRYLVLMPGLNRVGVSRKIADEAQRRKLREIMLELNPPKGLGFIVRTAGLERSKRELARDLAYLLRLWKVILRRIKKAKAPALIYQESDMITRTIRDIFTSEIDTIWIDEPEAFERAQEFLRIVMPRFVDRLKLYDSKVPLFHKYGIEDEIAKIQRRHVPLPEGGSIVIDQTEALVAIDVNSGNFRVENDAERTAYEMNLRAAKEIARQLRLRDLGGVIVNDFIDMREERNRRGVERALRDAVKRDRARTKVLRMSQFGLIEMTRQRIRPSLKRSVYEDCPHCRGASVVKTTESMAIDVMRLLALAAHREEIRRINVSVTAAVAAYLNNRRRREIAGLEAEANLTIHVRHEPDSPSEFLQLECFDAQNNEVRLLPAPVPPTRRGR
jgi:ribonuclease E